MVPWAHQTWRPIRHLDQFILCSAALYNGPPFPLKITRSYGASRPLSNNSLGLSERIAPTTSRLDQPFLHSSQQCPHTLQWATPSALKIAPFRGDIEPHLIHGSLDPPKSSTVSRSVQPFLQGSLVRQTARLTNRVCYLAGNSRPHLRMLYCDAAS